MGSGGVKLGFCHGFEDEGANFVKLFLDYTVKLTALQRTTQSCQQVRPRPQKSQRAWSYHNVWYCSSTTEKHQHKDCPRGPSTTVFAWSTWVAAGLVQFLGFSFILFFEEGIESSDPLQFYGSFYVPKCIKFWMNFSEFCIQTEDYHTNIAFPQLLFFFLFSGCNFSAK